MSKGQLLLFAVVCASFLWQEGRCSPARGLTFSREIKIPRTIRAPFRNTQMMTARGFGKRSDGAKFKDVVNSWMLTKSDDSEDYAVDPVGQMVSESGLESFPIDWLVDELISSPVLAKAFLSRFVDRNKDGLLEAEELLLLPSPHPTRALERNNF